MIETLTLIAIAIGSFVLGAVTLLGYMIHRMMGKPGWDDSNITNALRLLSHVTLHPTDFGKMYYINEHARIILNRNEFHFTNRDRPFWYVDKDELSEVVKSRAPK